MTVGEQQQGQSSVTAFTRTEPPQLGILAELRALEPLFHCEAFGTSVAAFEQRMTAEYWEVGASGRRYSRDFILRHFSEDFPCLAADLGWKTLDHALRQLGPQTYLLTYVLEQGERRTRRASIWSRAEKGWCVLYHQGTVVAAEEDDQFPI